MLTDRQRVHALARAARKEGIVVRLSISERGYGAHGRAMRLLGVYGFNPPAHWAYSTINARENSAYYFTPYSGDRLTGELFLSCDSHATAEQLAAMAASFGFAADASYDTCYLTAKGGAA